MSCSRMDFFEDMPTEAIIFFVLLLALFCLFIWQGIASKSKVGKVKALQPTKQGGDALLDDLAPVRTTAPGYYRYQLDNQRVIERNDLQQRIVDEYFIVKYGENVLLKALKVLAYLTAIIFIIPGIINESSVCFVFMGIFFVCGFVLSFFHKRSKKFPEKLMSHEEYEKLVKEHMDKLDVRKMALRRLGIDSDQVKEVMPIRISDKVINSRSLKAFDSLKNEIHSSTQYVTMVFFTNEQIYMYKLQFDMCCNEIKEWTSEYFYEDICDVSSCIEKNTLIFDDKSVEYSTMEVKVIATNSWMSLTVNGTNENFDGENEKIKTIRAMTQKIRERRNK